MIPDRQKLLVLSKKVIYETSNTEKIFFFFFCVGVTLALIFLMYLGSPTDFAKFSTIRIEKGSNLSSTATTLKDHRLIRSEFWFRVMVVMSGGQREIKAGDYYFGRQENTLNIAIRMIEGDYGLVPVRITIFEGLNVSQTAELLSERFDLFDKEIFLAEAKEGYLFPDTYFFLSNVSAEEVISKMTQNFETQIQKLQISINETERSLENVIILASIVEEEAIGLEDKGIVAGILLKRLELGMPLQADSTFSYVNGKNTYELSLDDLNIESPYNSYRNTGLPPTPISNPGLDSIIASINPTNTEYLYFLSDLKGKMYFAEDFDGHQINREKYLRK